MQLLPALDLRHGRVVRLRQGRDDERTTYELEPLQVLLDYARAGVEMAHVVDLDAAFGEPPQRQLLAALGSHAEVPKLELGGGLRDADSVGWALANGFARVVLTSMLVQEPKHFAALAQRYPGCLVAALDVDGKAVRHHGWQEAAERPVEEIGAGLRELPLAAVLVTDIQRDGTMAGPNVELACRLSEWSGHPALLSGGVHSLLDLERARQYPQIAGAVVGKALYDGAFTLADALRACRGGGS